MSDQEMSDGEIVVEITVSLSVPGGYSTFRRENPTDLCVHKVVFCTSCVILCTNEGTFIWNKANPSKLRRHVFSVFHDLSWYNVHNGVETYVYNGFAVNIDTIKGTSSKTNYHCAAVLNETAIISLNPNERQLTLRHVCEMFYGEGKLRIIPKHEYLLPRFIVGIAVVDGVGYFRVADKAVVLLDKIVWCIDVVDYDKFSDVINRGFHYFYNNVYFTPEMIPQHLVRTDMSNYEAVYSVEQRQSDVWKNREEAGFYLSGIAKSWDQQKLSVILDSDIFGFKENIDFGPLVRYTMGEQRAKSPLLYINMSKVQLDVANIRRKMASVARSLCRQKQVSLLCDYSYHEMIRIVNAITFDRDVVPTATYVDQDYNVVLSGPRAHKQFMVEAKVMINGILASIDSEKCKDIPFYKLGITTRTLLLCDEMSLLKVSPYVYWHCVSPALYHWFCSTNGIELPADVVGNVSLTRTYIDNHFKSTLSDTARNRYDKFIAGFKYNESSRSSNYLMYAPELMHDMFCRKVGKIRFCWENNPDIPCQQDIIDTFAKHIGQYRGALCCYATNHMALGTGITVIFKQIQNADYIVDTCNSRVMINVPLSMESLMAVIASLSGRDYVFTD